MNVLRWPIACVLTAALIAASYPLAIAAHLVLDALLGDGLLLRELLYGSQRAVAADLARSWGESLIWVLAAWAALALLRRVLGPSSAVAAAILGAAALLAAAAGIAAIPALPAWLLLACVALEAAGHALAVRRIAAWL